MTGDPEAPVLYLDAGDGEWSVLLPDGTVLNDRSVASDPTPVNYDPLITALGAVAHALNAASDESCRRITQALASP